MLTNQTEVRKTAQKSEQEKLERLKKGAFFVPIEEIFQHHPKQSSNEKEAELIKSKLTGGEIFKCLSKYLEKNPHHDSIKISHPCFKHAGWNDLAEEVIIVKTKFRIPARLGISGDSLSGYTILERKKTEDFIKGYVKLEELIA
ncbi:MAG: hypothetical protein WCQ32_03525 [bacterium]